MSSHANPQTTRVVILAALDSTPASEQVIVTASRLARGMAGAELHLLHVVDAREPDEAFPSTRKDLEAARALLEGASASAAEAFGGRIVGHLAAGAAWREIVQTAANVQADLVVVGTHDRTGVKRLVLGSVAELVAKKAPCAVLVARPKDTAAMAPEIEPPCPDCVAVQRETAGAKLWCERHGARHVQARLHYETPPTFGVGSMLLRP